MTKESTYDRVLIALVLLGPLLLFALNKWRASLDVPYAPPDDGRLSYFDERFERNLVTWLSNDDAPHRRLIVVADRECPCTKAALRSLDAAVAGSSRTDIELSVRYIDDADPPGGSTAWRNLLEELPATPTLLAIDGGQLVYAGPVNSGNLCTTSVRKVLGVAVLQTPRSSPVVSWLDRGCYCRLKRAHA